MQGSRLKSGPFGIPERPTSAIDPRILPQALRFRVGFLKCTPGPGSLYPLKEPKALRPKPQSPKTPKPQNPKTLNPQPYDGGEVHQRTEKDDEELGHRRVLRGAWGLYRLWG